MDEWHVDPPKILKYLLSDTNVEGAPKSRFFRAFGFRPEVWQVMREALLAHPKQATLHDIDDTSPYGRKFIYQCQFPTPDQRNPCILSVWQRRGGDYWFITAHPVR